MGLGFAMRYFAPEFARQAADTVARATGEKNLPLRRSPVIDAVNRYLPVSFERPSLTDRVDPRADTIDALVARSGVGIGRGSIAGYSDVSSGVPSYVAMSATRAAYGLPSSEVSSTLPGYADAPQYAVPAAAQLTFTEPKVYTTGISASYPEMDVRNYR